jgi:release factor glutamine methyltransferase
MKTIGQALAEAEAELRAAVGGDSCRLDAEVLLADITHKNRSYFFAFAETVLTVEQWQRYQSHLTQACSGKPIAYITGCREFWSLDLKVTPATLIPRPDSETLVEAVLDYYADSAGLKTLIDLGTGSGALAIALQHERQDWQLYACDYSAAALAVADENAATYRAAIGFFQGSWLDACGAEVFDAVIANPPYIAANDKHLKDLSFEPLSALVAANNGLADIENITAAAARCLRSGGTLWLEHGFEQAAAVRAILLAQGFIQIDSGQDLAGLDRISFGVKP